MKPTRIRWAAAAVLALCSQAHGAAVMFNAPTNTATLLFSKTEDGAVLQASVKFTLTSWSATSATFATVVTNSSTGAGQNVLMAFGITAVSPTLTGASTNGAGWGAAIDKNFPSFQNIDLCVMTGNNCAGGSINGGIGMNTMSSFNLTLTTDASHNFMTQGIGFDSPYAVKFQGIGRAGGSDEFAGCVSGTAGCGGSGGVGTTATDIPEPSAMALIAAAMLAAGLTRRVLPRLARIAR